MKDLIILYFHSLSLSLSLSIHSFIFFIWSIINGNENITSFCSEIEICAINLISWSKICMAVSIKRHYCKITRKTFHSAIDFTNIPTKTNHFLIASWCVRNNRLCTKIGVPSSDWPKKKHQNTSPNWCGIKSYNHYLLVGKLNYLLTSFS